MDVLLKWAKSVAIKTAKTMAETALAVIGTSMILSQVDWLFLLSSTALSGIVTILFNIKKLPESEGE